MKILDTSSMAMRGRILAVGGAVALALILAWIAVCSGREREPAPFAVSESEIRAECMTGTFVPEQASSDIEERGPPRDWRQLEEAPKAMPAERGAVRVTLRPTNHQVEKIALTAVDFRVFNHGLRPTGGVFYRPCKRHLAGAAIETDLDGYVHRVISSGQSGALRVGFHLPRQSSPIHFPWTVSLTKPLNLYLLVQARDIYCDWIARISWTSESSHGTIRVDNSGKKYRIVDGQGSAWYKPGPNGQWADSGSSRWIGVR